MHFGMYWKHHMVLLVFIGTYIVYLVKDEKISRKIPSKILGEIPEKVPGKNLGEISSKNPRKSNLKYIGKVLGIILSSTAAVDDAPASSRKFYSERAI